jgi:SAM-dependent methyltransferase
MTRESYTHGHHPSVLQSHTWRTVENSAAYLIPDLVPGASVLDVGCGPGTITVDIAERVAPGRVVGMDASTEIVEQAAERARERGLTNVEFVVGNAYALDFPDGTFDVVHAHQVLQHVARPVDVLREMRRVRTANGVVAARDVDWGGTMWHPELSGLQKWISVSDQVHRANGGEARAGRKLKAWAREAGFTQVAASASIWCFESDEDRAWWGTSWSQRTLHSQFAKDALGGGFATEQDLHEISDAWLEYVENPDAWYAMSHGEILGRG